MKDVIYDRKEADRIQAQMGFDPVLQKIIESRRKKLNQPEIIDAEFRIIE